MSEDLDKKALAMRVDGRKTFAEIAEALGFQNANHAYAACKRANGGEKPPLVSRSMTAGDHAESFVKRLEHVLSEVDDRESCHCDFASVQTFDDLVHLGAGCKSAKTGGLGYVCSRLDAVRRKIGHRPLTSTDDEQPELEVVADV